MSRSSTSERIVRTVRGAEKPALSAADLAEELGVSVKTINNNVEDLIERGEVESTQIGNAQAYYIPDAALPGRQKPDHTCSRCGRQADDLDDIAKLELDTYFRNTSIEDESTDFHIMCRFCYSDLVSWLYNDPNTMGEYPNVHRWNIPEKQLREVRNNPDHLTHPGEPGEHLTDYKTAGYEILQSLIDDPNEPIDEGELRDALREELGTADAQQAFRWLESCGYFYRKNTQREMLPAK